MYIVTGDVVKLPVTLKKKVSGVESTFVISGSAVIKAVIISTDGLTVLSDTVTVNLLETGTDLANSKIIVPFSKIESANITMPANKATIDAVLEIQVADPDETTWFANVSIKKGNIS